MVGGPCRRIVLLQWKFCVNCYHSARMEKIYKIHSCANMKNLETRTTNAALGALGALPNYWLLTNSLVVCTIQTIQLLFKDSLVYPSCTCTYLSPVFIVPWPTC